MSETSGTPELRSGTVALVGWTNVGKSTLLNALVGTKLAAVADVAQTTRHRIRGALWDPARGQIVFVDTPGIHRPKYRMNQAMVEASREALVGVDLALLVVDASRGYGPGDREVTQILERLETPRMMVLNKIDTIRPKTKLLPMIEEGVSKFGFEDVVPVSALSGDGCDHLLETIWNRMPVAPPAYDEDYLTDQSERVLAAEWIREKLLAETRQELPHATAVYVESWQIRDDGLLNIEATILVDRTSQKRIVIGSGGGVLKRVGTAARQEIEAFLERKVFLRLWVKVREDWRNDHGTLEELGIR